MRRHLYSPEIVQPKENLTDEEVHQRVELYWAITIYDVDSVKKYMENGYDPNVCRGEGWYEATPLNIIAKSFYDTYARFGSPKREMPEPLPDVEMFQLLVDAGADVNRRPYIWCRVYTYKNSYLESIARDKNLGRLGREPSTSKEMEDLKDQHIMEPLYFINDANRVIEAFLKAGADPDMRGHPYPYSYEAKLYGMNDEEANKYFSQGVRPINEAIRKGMRWESQVDLLLQYTTLDEDSLKAAKESKDRAMRKKIEKLWKEQNTGSIYY
jgi:hypothetical protein